MPRMTDPYDALVGFQKAFLSGSIKPKRCTSNRDLYVYRDMPAPGEKRTTYVMITGRQVKALAVYVDAEPYEGKRCYGVGYAVALPFRGKGLAKRVLAGSLEEFARTENKESEFYVEAVVGVGNERSHKVAEEIISQEPEAIFESESGQPAMYYLKHIQSAMAI